MFHQADAACLSKSLTDAYSMQVNVISPSVLALLLLPLMVRTSREQHTIPRTVITSSSMHCYVPPYGDDMFLQPELLKAISDVPEYEYALLSCTSHIPLIALSQSSGTILRVQM